MAEYPAMPLWTDAYLGDTSHLTTIEHGAYFLLLLAMWRSGGSLPNDDKKLARYSRLTMRQWMRIKDTIWDFFEATPDEITQRRLTAELTFVRQRCKMQSDRAKSRWLKNKKPNDATAMPEGCRSDAPTPTPTPTYKKNSPKGELVISQGSMTPPDQVGLMVESWNVLAEQHRLPKVQTLTETRRKKAKARLKDLGGLDGWREALVKVSQSPLCLGNNDRGWRANFDFLMQPSKLAKLMEGNYSANGSGMSGIEIDDMIEQAVGPSGGVR